MVPIDIQPNSGYFIPVAPKEFWIQNLGITQSGDVSRPGSYRLAVFRNPSKIEREVDIEPSGDIHIYNTEGCSIRLYNRGFKDLQVSLQLHDQTEDLIYVKPGNVIGTDHGNFDHILIRNRSEEPGGPRRPGKYFLRISDPVNLIFPEVTIAPDNQDLISHSAGDSVSLTNTGPTTLRVHMLGVDSVVEEKPSVSQPKEDNYSIILSGESYSLLEIPAESSAAVIAGKEAILENLRLDNLVTGLERASGLVYVAQNGVAGFGSLMAAMTGLGDGIISATADASLTLSGFSDDSEAILRSLRRSMDFLLKGREKLAVRYLTKCAKSAQEMSTESEKLADRFDELGDQTIEVLQDTQIAQGRQHQKIADERRQLAELKANNAAAQTLKQELATQQSQLKSMYQEAKKQQEKTENRAFAMQIIGAITGALGAGLNSVMGGMGGGRATPAPATAPAPAPTPVAESPAPTQTAEPETEGSDASAKEAEAAIKGVAAAASATAQRTGPIASSQQTAGQSYRDEKMKYLDKLLEVEANQRKALADIAKYAELLKSSAEEKKIAETTAAALHQAVGALKSIAATLRDNAFFWQLMTRACEKLAEPDFLEFIQDVSDLPFEERLELYLEDDFKVEIVTYYAQWQALKLVCDEYSTAVFDARAKMMEDFQQNPTIEEAQKQAPILAGQLLADTQADLQALDARTAEIEAEQAAIEVNAEAVV